MKMPQYKRERIDYLMGYETNTAKDQLLLIMYQLEELGAKRKANSLRTIVERLEKWQH